MKSDERFVSALREEYSPRTETENKVERIKKLNRKVKLPATVFAYIFGVLGALVLGVGMCLAMKVIGDLMPLGIAVGCVGIVMVAVTYPIYALMVKARKKKYADAIVALSDEILNR